MKHLTILSCLTLLLSSSVFADTCKCPANFDYLVTSDNVMICSNSVGQFPAGSILEANQISSGGRIGYSWPVASADVKNNTIDYSSCDSGYPTKGSHSVDSTTNRAYCYWFIDWTVYEQYNINYSSSNLYAYSTPPGHYDNPSSAQGTSLQGSGAIGFALKWIGINGADPTCSLH